MKTIGSSRKIVVSSDGQGIVCQAGGLLLVEALRVSGLAQGLSQALSGWRRPRAVHDPGKIITDLAVMPALGGDCLADVAVLRSSPELFGPIASDPTVSRLVATCVHADNGRRHEPPTPLGGRFYACKRKDYSPATSSTSTRSS
ncbi:transposase [Nonomuraea sp. NPDC049400]|uniref:transposase n=1 Tax=Nonomuraea sp. NPDC049400 TaxID=3364352 RepID=UPI0037B1F0EB